MRMCPNCGKFATFSPQWGSFVDTHGLDCGPFERWTEEWLVCGNCGARTDDSELEAMSEYEADAFSLFETEPEPEGVSL